MKYIKLFLGIVLMIIVASLIYFGGLIKPHYIYNLVDKVDVFDKELKFKVEKVSWFKRNKVNVRIKGDYDLNKLGHYEIELYDDDYLISKYMFEVVDRIAPTLKLNGNKTMVLFQNQEFVDEGVEVYDNYDQNLKVKTSKINLNKLGKQEIIYKVVDSSGNEQKVIRNIYVYQDPLQTTIKYDYDTYDNNYLEWWFHKSSDHQRNDACMSSEELSKYHAYYIGEASKVLYLTFDEGGNDVTYVKEIAEVLNQEKIKATFFFTRNYLLSEPEFVNELVKAGHLVANHSWHHYDMSNFANENQINEFIKELTMFEQTYMEVCKQEMTKVFRFPKGGFSERCLKIVADLGYRSYFWSHAYYDYAYDLSYDEAYHNLMDYYHPGAIYLIHPSNKGNYEALGTFIQEMKKLGYRFATVDEIK